MILFQEFQSNVLDHYPAGMIVMNLNNARIHSAKLLKPFLEQNENRIELFFLQPYSPELNLM